MTADVVRLPCGGLGIRTWHDRDPANDRDVVYVIRPDTQNPGPWVYKPSQCVPVDDVTRHRYCELASRAVADRISRWDALTDEQDPACAVVGESTETEETERESG